MYTANRGFVLCRMGRKAVTLENLIVLQVGPGKTSGLWMSTEPWMIKVQIFTIRRVESSVFCKLFISYFFLPGFPGF